MGRSEQTGLGTTPIVAPARLRAPLARGLRRARLIERLAALDDQRLGLVIAPAGSGKTTLLSQFAATADCPVAWYRADGADATEASILAQLHRAVGVALAGTAPDLGPAWTTVDEASAALDSVPVDRLVIIADDVHSLHGTAAEAALGRLVEQVRPGIALVLGSRRTPSFSVSRARVAGDLLEISADDLRFRPWEVEQLFRDVYGDALPPIEMTALTQRTEGWAAGLQLFHLAAKGKTPAERARLVGALGSRSRLVREYLAENVLEGLADELRSFLVETCVLSRLSGPLCDDLLVREHSEEVLIELERRQLFTVALDDDGSYRYHEVLRSHLEASLISAVGGPAARDRYRLAGALHEKAGFPVDAIRAYSRAEDWQAVGRLLADRSDALGGDNGAWVDTLPAALIAEDPWLMLASARRARANGRLDAAVEAYERAEALFGVGAGVGIARAERSALRPWVTDRPDRTPGWSAVLRAATQRNPLHEAREASLITGAIGRLVEGICLLIGGRADDAREALLDAVSHPQASGAVAVAAGAVALLTPWWGTSVGSGLDARVIVEQADDLGLPWATRVAAALLVLAPDEAGRPGAYGEEIEGLRRLGDAELDAWGAAVVALVAGLAGVYAGDAPIVPLDEACARFRFLGAGALEVWCRAALAHALTTGGRPGAVETAREAAADAKALGVPGAQALALLAIVRVDPSGTELARAEAVARDAGVSLPVRLLEIGVGSESSTAMPASAAASAASSDAPAIRVLGGFEISVGGTRIDTAAAKPRVRALLHLLAVHAPRPVHREVLCEALWPETDQATGTRNLQVAVSSLRSLLEPGAARGDHVIVRRDGDAYRLDPCIDERQPVSDLWLLRVAVERGRAGDPSGWSDALGLVTGDAVPEAGPVDWAVEVRADVASLVSLAARSVADAAIAGGRPDQAVAACELGLRVARYEDALWRLLVEARRMSGDHAAAARAEADYLEVLGELGVA